MNPADFFWFVFSTSGVLVSIALATIWTFARPRSRAARRCLAAVVAGYAIVSVYPVPRAVERWLARPFHPLTAAEVPAGRTAIVLLSSDSYPMRSWSGDSLSVLDLASAARTLEAYRVFRLLDTAFVISSSGVAKPRYPGQSTGRAMRDVLVSLGVPAERVVVEETSKTTRDQAVVVSSMLPSLRVDHVVLVTSPIHMRRALSVFRGAGINAIPAMANEPHDAEGWRTRFLPTRDGLNEASAVAHELLGLGYYAVRGWR